MTYLAFLGGVLLGSLLANIVRYRRIRWGTLNVDEKNDLCQVSIPHTIDLSNVKVVQLDVKHNIDLSQKEQSL